MKKKLPYKIIRDCGYGHRDVEESNDIRFNPCQLSVRDSRLFYAILLCDHKYSFLPDLFDALGEDVAVMTRVVNTFTGLEISFPTNGNLQDCYDELKIYRSVEATPEEDRLSMYYILEGEFDKDITVLRKIYDRVKTIAKTVGAR